MKRIATLWCLFALFLLAGQIALAQQNPSVTITGTAPGPGAGMINVTYTYKNAPMATQVRYVISNPPNVHFVNFPIGANGKGADTVQTPYFNAQVTVVVELRDKKNQAIVASAPVNGQTK